MVLILMHLKSAASKPSPWGNDRDEIFLYGTSTFETKLFFYNLPYLCNAYASFVLHAVMLLVECLRCEPAAGEPQVGPPVSTLNTRNDLIHSVLYCRSEAQV